jgi:hypothetical protein
MKIDPNSIAQKMRETAESAVQQAKESANTISETVAPKMEEAKEKAEKRGEVLSKKAGAAATEAKGFLDITAQASQAKMQQMLDSPAGRIGTKIFEIVTDDGASGTSMDVDRGMRPRSFDYGERGETIIAGNFPIGLDKPVEADEANGEKKGDVRGNMFAGLRGRLFGHLDKENFNALLGGEFQLGAAASKTRKTEFGEEHIEEFAGTQARAYVEGGPLGASAGFENFTGVELIFGAEESRYKGQKTIVKSQIELGVRDTFLAHAGLFGASISAERTMGLRERFEVEEFLPLPGTNGEWQVFARGNTDIFAGLATKARIASGFTPTFIGQEAGFEAFLGVKARLQSTIGIGHGGKELLAGYVYGEGWAGIGVKANVKTGYDVKSGEIGVSGDVGAAIGVGGGLGFGVVTPLGDFEKGVIDKTIGIEKEEKWSKGGQAGPNLSKPNRNTTDKSAFGELAVFSFDALLERIKENE